MSCLWLTCMCNVLSAERASHREVRSRTSRCYCTVIFLCARLNIFREQMGLQTEELRFDNWPQIWPLNNSGGAKFYLLLNYETKTYVLMSGFPLKLLKLNPECAGDQLAWLNPVPSYLYSQLPFSYHYVLPLLIIIIFIMKAFSFHFPIQVKHKTYNSAKPHNQQKQYNTIKHVE